MSAPRDAQIALVKFVLSKVGADTENPYVVADGWGGSWGAVEQRTDDFRADVDAYMEQRDGNLAAALVDAFNAGSEDPL